jgi:hypothetical protein
VEAAVEACVVVVTNARVQRWPCARPVMIAAGCINELQVG